MNDFKTWNSEVARKPTAEWKSSFEESLNYLNALLEVDDHIIRKIGLQAAPQGSERSGELIK